MSDAISGVAVIVENSDGTFLLHLRDENASVFKNQWCLIGGSCDPDEVPADTARREVHEETNLSPINVTHLYDYSFRDKTNALFHVTVDTTNEKLEVREGRDFKFVSKEDALRLIESLDYKSSYLDMLVDYLHQH